MHIQLKLTKTLQMNTKNKSGSKIADFTLFFALTILYIHTGATTLTGEDSGSFQLALTSLGINHPPGYPLYTILGFAFVQLLSIFASETHAVNLFSAFWTILCLWTLNLVLLRS